MFKCVYRLLCFHATPTKSLVVTPVSLTLLLQCKLRMTLQTVITRQSYVSFKHIYGGVFQYFNANYARVCACVSCHGVRLCEYMCTNPDYTLRLIPTKLVTLPHSQEAVRVIVRDKFSELAGRCFIRPYALAVKYKAQTG